MKWHNTSIFSQYQNMRKISIRTLVLQNVPPAFLILYKHLRFILFLNFRSPGPQRGILGVMGGSVYWFLSKSSSQNAHMPCFHDENVFWYFNVFLIDQFEQKTTYYNYNFSCYIINYACAGWQFKRNYNTVITRKQWNRKTTL